MKIQKRTHKNSETLASLETAQKSKFKMALQKNYERIESKNYTISVKSGVFYITTASSAADTVTVEKTQSSNGEGLYAITVATGKKSSIEYVSATGITDIFISTGKGNDRVDLVGDFKTSDGKIMNFEIYMGKGEDILSLRQLKGEAHITMNSIETIEPSDLNFVWV